MNSYRLAAILGLMASLCGGPVLARSADEAAAMAADNAFYAASVRIGGKAWAEFADADVRLPFASGKDAVGTFYRKVYARPGFSLSWHPTTAFVAGDIAVTSGPYEGHRRDTSGRDIRETGTYVTVWQRQKAGGWRYVWDGGTESR